jgi:oxygen-independent coproporphyrinogen-3 oxidase
LKSALSLADKYPEIFTIQYPPGKRYFQERYRYPVRLDALQRLDKVLLYLHIPFCDTKCFYCNFATDTRKDQKYHEIYVKSLIKQLEKLDNVLPSECHIPGIDIGGGTPTLISVVLLEQILQALEPWRKRVTVPWPLSIETSPRVAATDGGKLKLLASAGISRISMGIQSTSDDILAKMNRKSSFEARAIENLLMSGFRRVNIDLVFGLPGQTLKHWKEDVRKIIGFGPDSITAYDCLYRGEGRMLPECQPSPEEYGRLYDLAYETLTANGYNAPYGSENFSRHPDETGTSPYFEGRLLDGLPYIGVGNYASSLLGNQWWFAPYKTDDWIRSVEEDLLPAGDTYTLPDEELMAKYILLSLSFGIIDPERFHAIFNQSLKAQFGKQLEFCEHRNWLENRNGQYLLVNGQFKNIPYIRALFYPATAINWLRELLSTQKNHSTTHQIIRSL